MSVLKGSLAKLVSRLFSVPQDAPTSFKYGLSRGLLLRLLKSGFFKKRCGIEEKEWTPVSHILLENDIEMQETLLAEGTSACYYFDFSALRDC